MDRLYERPDIYDLAYTEETYKILKEHYMKMFKDCQISSILDCSFGTGNLTIVLAEMGYKVSASDISEAMLEKGREKALKKGLDIELKQCDFRNLSKNFHDKYDCVMSTGNSLPYVKNDELEKVLREMDALVRDKGYLYFDIRNWDKIIRTHQRFYFYPPFFKDDIRINLFQIWDHNSDGTITFNIVYSFEKENKVIQREIFEEIYNPVSKDFIIKVLDELGYYDFKIKPYPYIREVELEDVDWYCLLARKK
ncbi:class I SAM-dependent methyltransferase [Lutispora thermophila]|uniref:Methyltransferase domain-containing protein n=1 Tax=Lutispora thermophila DSM 19022 TaxID=1122184 RepID=A0A1M6B731_9FIRM|nr:class I SAM-dependent methyltransferase [Lutispora thermophila]SHI44398.1 Methyltransferase domain-containing protein [Lutispora thermophila DSM 19022]